jgi:hypothetical protein
MAPGWFYDISFQTRLRGWRGHVGGYARCAEGGFPFSVFRFPFSVFRFPFSVFRFPFSVSGVRFLPQICVPGRMENNAMLREPPVPVYEVSVICG